MMYRSYAPSGIRTHQPMTLWLRVESTNHTYSTVFPKREIQNNTNFDNNVYIWTTNVNYCKSCWIYETLTNCSDDWYWDAVLLVLVGCIWSVNYYTYRYESMDCECVTHRTSCARQKEVNHAGVVLPGTHRSATGSYVELLASTSTYHLYVLFVDISYQANFVFKNYILQFHLQC